MDSHSPVDVKNPQEPGLRQPWSTTPGHRTPPPTEQPDSGRIGGGGRGGAPLNSFNQAADFNSDLSQPRSLSYYEIPSTTTTATFMAYPLPAPPVTSPPGVPPPAVRYATAGSGGKSHFPVHNVLGKGP